MAQNPPNNGAPPPNLGVANAANNAPINPLELAVLNDLMDIGAALTDAHKTEEEKEEIAASITAFLHALRAGEEDAQLGFQSANIGPNVNDDMLEQLKANIRAVVDTQNAQLIENVDNTIYIVMMIGGPDVNQLNEQDQVHANNVAGQQGAPGGPGGPGHGGARQKRKTRRGRRSTQRRRRNTRRRRLSRRK